MARYNNRYGAPTTSSRGGSNGETPYRVPNQSEAADLDDYDIPEQRERTSLGPGFDRAGETAQDMNVSDPDTGATTGYTRDPNLGGGYDWSNLPATAELAEYSPPAAEAGPYSGDPYDDIMTKLMGLIDAGPRDTAEEEKLIQDMYAGKMGAGMGDLAAQFGAGGMGQSGALLGAGADLQGKLSRDASRELLDVRQAARDEYYNNLFNAVSGTQAERGLGMDEDKYAMLREIILGETDPSAPDSGMGGEDSPYDHEEYDASQEAGLLDHITSGASWLQEQLLPMRDEEGRSMNNWVDSRDEVPGMRDGSARKVGVRAGQEIWQGSDGNTYHVPIQAGG